MALSGHKTFAKMSQETRTSSAVPLMLRLALAKMRQTGPTMVRTELSSGFCLPREIHLLTMALGPRLSRGVQADRRRQLSLGTPISRIR